MGPGLESLEVHHKEHWAEMLGAFSFIFSKSKDFCLRVILKAEVFFCLLLHRAVTAHPSRHLTDRQVISDGIPKAAARRAGASG